MERLNRFLARSGVSSRRSADELIASGRVKVNGVRPPATGQLVDPAQDQVTLDGQVVRVTERVHYAFNKPVGYLTSMSDPEGRPVFTELLPPDLFDRTGIFPVGRLDQDTHGLLLLSSDGELSNRLLHPRHQVEKEYLATVIPAASPVQCRRLVAGVELYDGMARAVECEPLERLADGRGTVRMVLTIGRNRIARRMLAEVGLRVLELQRVRFGPVRLGRLKPGGHRHLRPDEVAALVRLTGREVGPAE